MKINKLLMIALALVLVVSVPAVAFAANTPATCNTDATITLNKVFEPSAGNVYPDVSSFQYTLEPVSYTLASTGTTVADTGATYMPAGDTITVNVAENATHTAKEGTASKTLSFAGKEIGVYTYKLTEVNGGVTGVTYDDMEYYVNIYVINQVDENGVATGNVTISDITAWEVNNMPAEALKALTADWTGALVDVDTDEAGKVAHSTDGTISYPFENSYETKADINLTKVIKGNYSNVNQLFAYTVTINDGLATAGTYNITYTNPDSTATEATNPTTITSGTPVTIKLAHNQTVNIADLPSSTTYTITEAQENTYSGTYAVVDGSTSPATGSAGTGVNLAVSGTLSDNSVTNNVLDDENITYTNTKEYTTPTGIILNILPFAAGLILVAALAVVASKRSQLED